MSLLTDRYRDDNVSPGPRLQALYAAHERRGGSWEIPTVKKDAEPKMVATIKTDGSQRVLAAFELPMREQNADEYAETLNLLL